MKHITKKQFMDHGWKQGDCIMHDDGDVYPVIGAEFGNNFSVQNIGARNCMCDK